MPRRPQPATRFEEAPPAAGAAALGQGGSGTGGEGGGPCGQSNGGGEGGTAPVGGAGSASCCEKGSRASPESGTAVSRVPSVALGVTESGVSAGSREGGDGLGREAGNGPIPKASSARHGLRIVYEVLSGAVRESSGSSSWDQRWETESRGACVPRGQGLRASGVTARTRLDLRGTTLPLLGLWEAPGPPQTPSSRVHPFSTGFPAFLSSLQISLYPSKKAPLCLSRWGCFPLPA